MSVREERGVGMYAPFTADGTLMVDNFAASSFVSIEELDCHPRVPSRVAFVSHAALAPFRVFCLTTSSNTCEQYDENGISLFPASLVRLYQRTSQNWAWWIVAGFYLCVAVCILALEGAYSASNGYLFLIVFPIAAYILLSRRQKIG